MKRFRNPLAPVYPTVPAEQDAYHQAARDRAEARVQWVRDSRHRTEDPQHTDTDLSPYMRR